MNRIKYVRKLRGYSQQSLADALQVNQTAVSQWERGTTTPSNTLLTKLVQLLNVSSDYLLGLSDDQNIYTWDDPEIMDEISKSMIDSLNTLNKVCLTQNKQNQKLLFDLFVELRCLLKSTPSEEDISYFIDYLLRTIHIMNKTIKKK